MIYLDSSVALAHVFAEPRPIPSSLWQEDLVSSRLLEYEVWNRVHSRGMPQVSATVGTLLSRIGFFELDHSHLARALEAFPMPVRTLDSLHLATIESLRQNHRRIALASFDRRMLTVARALGIPLYEPLSP